MIGTRHGEKLYETLATREELVALEDQGDYFRVPVDARDLNYGAYYDEGDVEESHTDDYHSHNTERLDVDQVVALLQACPTSGSWSGPPLVTAVHSSPGCWRSTGTSGPTPRPTPRCCARSPGTGQTAGARSRC